MQTREISDENEDLKLELAATKEKMQSMIDEFGNMFGGGSDHELAKHEVVDKMLNDEGKSETVEQN